MGSPLGGNFSSDFERRQPALPTAWLGNATPSSLARDFIGIVETLEREIPQRFSRQQASLQHFNIAFFGRTGAGKSTLIEALCGGDGASVSPGRSDHTTEVRAVRWGDCVLHDSPGISGWGRTAPREELEERARRAAEVADIVILAFDSQSQQAAEFEKIARWIEALGKPAIAVLNCRNALWRMPTEAPYQTARAQLSRAVAEHARNVADELGRIGVIGVPIVAVHAWHALVARASGSYAGPHAGALAKLRERHGHDRLNVSSNLLALEALLAAILEEDAAGIRAAMLRDEMLKALGAAVVELGAQREHAAAVGHELERYVESVLQVIGYPDPAKPSARAPFTDSRVEADLLTELERLRGRPFPAPVTGSFAAHTGLLLSSHLSACRLRALSSAEEAVLEAFERRAELLAEDLESRALPRGEIGARAQVFAREAARYLSEKLQVETRDLAADLECVFRASRVDGATGSASRRAGNAMQLGGIVSGVAAALVALLAASPAGWVPVTLGALAAALGFLGRSERKRGENARLEARSDALARARRSVHDAFDQLEAELLERTVASAHRVAHALLSEALLSAVVCRLVCARSEKAIRTLRRSAARVPKRIPAARLFSSAMRKVEERRFPGDLEAPRKVWLGEDWIDIPEGRVAAASPSLPRRTTAYDPGILQTMLERFRDRFSRIGRAVAAGSGADWLAEAHRMLAGDREAGGCLAELDELARAGRAQVHVCGDYSSGKTSFVKRLLADAGTPIPESLHVRADPSTERSYLYDWEGLVLVDHPGFQSGNPAHSEEALRRLADASSVLYLFSPNLVTGSSEALDAILQGNDERGLVSKLDRTFFVIHRADELGPDPMTSPEEYAQLCASKTRELVLALRSRGIPAAPSQVFCMAGDPHGLVGDRRDVSSSAYDPFRQWDGFGPFLQAFRSRKKELLAVGVDMSLLEGGIARMTRLRQQASAAENVLLSELRELRRMRGLLQGAAAEAKVLADDSRAALDRLCDDHATSLVDDALSSQDELAIASCVDRMKRWWEDAAFQSELTQWHARAIEAFGRWRSRTSDLLRRRLPIRDVESAPGDFTRPAHRGVTPLMAASASKVFGRTAKVLKLADRTVFRIGRVLGHDVEAAAEVSAALSKALGVLALAGAAYDAVSLVQGHRAEGAREKRRHIARESLRSQHAEVVEAMAMGTEDRPGPVRLFALGMADLEELVSEIAGAIHRLERDLRETLERRGRYDELILSARARLSAGAQEKQVA